MNTASILSNVLAKKGQFGRATYQKRLKIRKGKETTREGHAHVIEKRTSMTIRAGIDYDNLSAVKEKRANGDLPEVNNGLPWGSWVCFPYLISHNDKHYIRLYPKDGSIKSEYFLDGNPVDLDDVKGMLLVSELPKKDAPKPDCITVNLENIVEII